MQNSSEPDMTLTWFHYQMNRHLSSGCVWRDTDSLTDVRARVFHLNAEKKCIKINRNNMWYTDLIPLLLRSQGKFIENWPDIFTVSGATSITVNIQEANRLISWPSNPPPQWGLDIFFRSS
jgi:hypothetical protein